MAVRRLASEQPDTFAFTPENLAWCKAKIADYPDGRQASAVIPLLWRAQAQSGGWLPEPAIRLVADMLDMPYIRVFEIATFYTMFNLQPVGTVAHIGICGTTPCMLRGSEALLAIAKRRIAPRPFELSDDGRFSWEEVECAGACVNAPMIQIGADTFEDLTPEAFEGLLDALDRGERPQPGPITARRGSEPLSGLTSLTTPLPEREEAAAKGSDVEVSGAINGDVDPTSPAAADQDAALPDPRSRTEVAAARGASGAARSDSPVAPDASEPESADSERAAEAANRPAVQDNEAPVETKAPPTDEEARAALTRASFAADTPPPPVKADEVGVRAGAVETADAPAAPAAQVEAPAAPPAPDDAAAARADAAGTRPQALTAAEAGAADDLKRISGIGKVNEKTLHDLGIYRFEQIAGWDQSNKDWVAAYLAAFPGRIDREQWVEQAQAIVAARNADPSTT